MTKFKKYKKKQKSLINHRPKQFLNKSLKKIFKDKNLEFRYLTNKKVFEGLDLVLIGGAGIIEKKYIKKNFILNCHSGLIPQSRGLDSIKWAIFNQLKVGNSLHFIDENVDKGKIIAHKITDVKKYDSMNNFFKRHYNNEINMIINFEKYFKRKEIINLNNRAVNFRIPRKLEKLLKYKFILFKNKFVNANV